MLAKCFFIAVLAVGLFSCTNDSGGMISSTVTTEGSQDVTVFDEVNVFEYGEFQRQKAMWQEQGIGHYEFSGLTKKSDGSYNVTVTVFPDKEPVVFFQQEASNPGFKNELDTFHSWWRTNPFFYYKGITIDELYASIEKEINNRSNDAEFPHVFIQYDEKYHFPVKFFRCTDENLKPIEMGPGGYPLVPPAVGASFPYLIIGNFEDLRER